LLLEGDDLEALLLRAHAEGGVNAKIVRAEKVRHGGVLGFFAKEGFEVAVEIPETDDAATGTATGTVSDGSEPFDDLDRRGEPVAGPPDPSDDGRSITTPVESDGLLGLVDRVSDAEQSAARAAAAVVTRALEANSRPVTVLSPPESGASRSPDHGPVPSREKPAPLDPVTDRSEPTDPPPVPNPSTTRPEFTALLDQLKADAESERRPGRYDDLSRPVPEPRSRGERMYAEALSGDHGFTVEPSPASRIPGPRPSMDNGAGTGPTRGRSRNSSHDTGLVEDRRLLREFGVPSAWTRRLRGGDRFSAIMRMLDRMPDADLDTDLPVIAVVGPVGTVRWEAHRTALDLPVRDGPRPVVDVPVDRRGRGAAIARSHRSGSCVVAVEAVGYDDGDGVTETLQAVEADAVIVVIDAARPVEESQAWLDALGQVDAIVVDNAAASAAIAATLQLGVPVIRLDGIPVDRVTWTAVLCARLEAARPAR
jgi:hypothetical protein